MNKKILITGICAAFAITLGIFVYKHFGNIKLRKHEVNISAKSADASDYYSEWGKESERLSAKPAGVIERLRTESILKRYLPKSPAVIYDVGGGAGVYAFPLAQQGYAVHLIDFTPLHITQATARMKETGIKLAECSVGDARDIKASDAVADVVLFFGPLYHLQDKNDRLKALHEAYRILKPGGILFAASISRFAVFCDFGFKNKLHDSLIASVAQDVINTGKNNNPKFEHKFFVSGYFHHPDEFEKEVQDAGFKDVQVLGIEGPSWFFASLQEAVNNKSALNNLLALLEMIEKDRSVIGTSSHIMAIGKK